MVIGGRDLRPAARAVRGSGGVPLGAARPVEGQDAWVVTADGLEDELVAALLDVSVLSEADAVVDVLVPSLDVELPVLAVSSEAVELPVPVEAAIVTAAVWPRPSAGSLPLLIWT
jgi:hypothetical protein